MENKTVPYLAYELEQVKHERTVRRLVAALILAIILMFATNIAWIIMMSGYNMSSESIDVDSGGMANYIGRDGSIDNG